MVYWILSQPHLQEAGLTQYQETTSLQILTALDLL